MARRASIAAIALLLLAAVFGVAAEQPLVPITLWESQSGHVGFPTAQALLTDVNAFYGINSRDGAYACAFNTTIAPTVNPTVCAKASAGTFDKQFVPASGLAFHPVGSALAFSHAAVLGPNENTTVVYFTSQVGGSPRAYTYNVQAESVVSLAPLANSMVGLRYQRRAHGPGQQRDVVTIRSLADPTFPVVWTDEWVTPSPTVVNLPAFAENIIGMEDTLLYINQDSQNATLHMRNSSGAFKFFARNPCGVDASVGFVGLMKVPYQRQDTGEVLEAAIVIGKNKTVGAGSTIVCRFHHHSGQAGWTAVLQDVSTLYFLTGNEGQLAFTGVNAANTSAYVGVIDAETGYMRWTHTLTPSMNTAAGPLVFGGVVFFQDGPNFRSRGVYTGDAETRAAFECARTPTAIGSRVFCVSMNDELLAFAPMTNQILWTMQHVQWQFGPQALQNTNIPAVAVLTRNGALMGVTMDAQPLTPPPSNPAPPGGEGSDAGKVVGAIFGTLLVCGVIGGAIYFFVIRKGRFGGGGARRTGMHDLDINSGPAPTPKASHDAYGSTA